MWLSVIILNFDFLCSFLSYIWQIISKICWIILVLNAIILLLVCEWIISSDIIKFPSTITKFLTLHLVLLFICNITLTSVSAILITVRTSIIIIITICTGIIPAVLINFVTIIIVIYITCTSTILILVLVTVAVAIVRHINYIFFGRSTLN